jgi:hypothetical protein
MAMLLERMSTIVSARSFSSVDGLSLTQLSGRPRTPGNVGVALSGGGSRSAASSMGVMRALHHLDLLRHVRALSCVSGGAWFGVPFTFLPDRFDEQRFLGAYVEDPGELRWRQGGEPGDVRSLHDENFGVPLARFDLSTASIVAGALRNRHEGVATSRLWTRQIGEQLLAHFDLARFDGVLPSDCFAADESMAMAMAMASTLPKPYLMRASQTMPRPALIVGAAMRVLGYDGQPTLAPVQFTPWMSGAFGSKIGTLGGREVGGGGISSFAFGGQWLAGSREKLEVELHSPLSLSDVAGISSAAYADALNDKGLTDLSPALVYFSPDWDPPTGVHALLADGAAIDNTGIANLLAYDDIDAVLAIVNSPASIQPAPPRAASARNQIRDGEVVVDEQIGALFGYRKFERGVGYRRYEEPVAQVFAHEHGAFEQLVAALGARHEAGEPTVVAQELELVDNPRFCVRGGRKVRVLWYYLSPCRRWLEQLHPALRVMIGPEFPNFPTLRTALFDSSVSLLAHYTSWVLAQHRDDLSRLCSPDLRKT